MHLAEALQAVEQFHRRVGAPIASTPTLLPCDAAKTKQFAERIHQLAQDAAARGADVLFQRLALSLEELGELETRNALALFTRMK